MKAQEAQLQLANNIAALMDTAGEVKMPWTRGLMRPVNAKGLAYNGINVLACWVDQLNNDRTLPRYMTYKQARDLGGHVRKGEKSTPVFYYGSAEKATEQNGETQKESYRFLKYYRVFNAEQIDDLPSEFYQAPAQKIINPDKPNKAIEDMITALRVDVAPGRPCYVPGADRIYIPRFGKFKDAASYYAILFHELTHWTGAKHRLDRLNANGSMEGRAFEELVAELGAAFIGADWGIEAERREDHAAYLASWAQALRNDPRALFRAAAQASKAYDYIAQQLATS